MAPSPLPRGWEYTPPCSPPPAQESKPLWNGPGTILEGRVAMRFSTAEESCKSTGTTPRKASVANFNHRLTSMRLRIRELSAGDRLYGLSGRMAVPLFISTLDLK